MPTFNQLSQSDSVSLSDQIPVYMGGQGDLRRTSIGTLADVIIDQLNTTPDDTLYGLTVSGSTFSVALQPVKPGNSLWARLDPSSAATVATFVLPDFDYRATGQEILVTCTQSIASVLYTLNGTTTVGAPTSLAAGGFFRLRYDSISNTWNRVG